MELFTFKEGDTFGDLIMLLMRAAASEKSVVMKPLSHPNDSFEHFNDCVQSRSGAFKDAKWAVMVNIAAVMYRSKDTEMKQPLMYHCTLLWFKAQPTKIYATLDDLRLPTEHSRPQGRQA
jgi:hypothetical protein